MFRVCDGCAVAIISGLYVNGLTNKLSIMRSHQWMQRQVYSLYLSFQYGCCCRFCIRVHILSLIASKNGFYNKNALGQHSGVRTLVRQLPSVIANTEL